MLVVKEIVSPGTYWYTDESTGIPRKLDVTPELTKYWHEQGSAMLSAGLTVPVPFEHDFNAHPMTPKEKLLNNAGEVKEYRLKGDTLFGVIDIQDPDAKRKIGHSIRWTSPWINSFSDGDGKKWNNVISHLALTTRPRIMKQAPFSGIAAALSIATEVVADIGPHNLLGGRSGICISRAGRLVHRKSDKQLRPQYPLAFSIFSGGIKLAEDEDTKPLTDEGDEAPPKKPKAKGKPPKEGEPPETPETDNEEEGNELEPFKDPSGDVAMEELLADLLGALDIHVEKSGSPDQFKRALYNAAMTKIHELTGKARGEESGLGDTLNQPPGGPGNQTPPNPLVQQEQQPMYMSLEEINKIPDTTMKTIALSMYNENVKLRSEMDSDRKRLNSLNDAKLKEENAKRSTRVQMLSKLSPRVKADLDAMIALPAMALSMGEGGVVVDPMAQTLSVLEKGLSDMPTLLRTDSASLSVQQHPTDEDMLTQEAADEISDRMARKMGAAPLEQKKAN